MKKLMLVGAIASLVIVGSAAGWAHEYDKDDSDYPLRYVAYALYPVGQTVEYALLRPVHYMVSQPALSKVFGHEPCEPPGHDYFEFK